MKTVLILGAGVGGIITAHEIRKQLGDKVRIVMFERQPNHTFAPSLLWLMVGKRNRKQIQRANVKLSKYGEIVFGEIENINTLTKTVEVGGESFTGDYMIISLGAELQSPPELMQIGYNLYSTEGAENFYKALRERSKAKIAFLIVSLPFKCPAAPYEAAMLTDSFIRTTGSRQQVNIALYSPESGPMPVTGRTISNAVRSMLQEKDINYYSGYQYLRAESNMLHFANSESATFDLLGYIPHHYPPPIIGNAGMQLSEQGWVQVDKHTLMTSVQNVFALGDITSIMLPNGKPLPKAGVFAHEQAITIARTIANDILGKGTMRNFQGHGACFLELGHGQAGYATGNFYALPEPRIAMKNNSVFWHWSKIAFEKYWLLKYF